MSTLEKHLAGLETGAARSRIFLAPWNRSRLRKQTTAGAAPKKSGAGATKKIAAPAPAPRTYNALEHCTFIAFL